MSVAPCCPRCGGAQQIVFLAPGDKAARCNFCNLVIDLPDGETRTETAEEEVRPDGTRLVRHIVASRSDGIAPDRQEGQLKDLHRQLEGAAAASPQHADRIFQALGRLESGQATLKVISSSTTSTTTSTEPTSNMSSLPVGIQAQIAAALGGAPNKSTITVEWSDGRRYPGKLVEEQNGQCLVEFGDGSRRWVDASAVRR